jgi:phosphoserine phosphatase RsbU/P
VSAHGTIPSGLLERIEYNSGRNYRSMISKDESAVPDNLDSRHARDQLELKDRALAATFEGITIADLSLPDNPLIYVNAAFERLTGYSANEVLGRNCRFLQGPGTDLEAVTALRTAVRERCAVTVQLLNYRKDGTPFWNRLSITPVLDGSGAATHFIGVQSDVTVEKQAKDELQKANERLEAARLQTKRELEAAGVVQRSLLPVELRPIPGYHFAFKFRPCSDVGGDYLNVLPLDESHLAVYILDVAGHGVASALLSVTLSHMLSAFPDRSFLYQASTESPGSYSITPPAEVALRLNRHFLANPGALQFFTMIYGVLDINSSEFRYVSAGHLSPIHFPRGQAPVIREAGGVPAGLLPAATYEEHSLTLQSGDRLYFCTDGIYEAETPSGQELGVPGLIEMLNRYRDRSPVDVLSTVMQSVEEWAAAAGPFDDASILVIERQL